MTYRQAEDALRGTNRPFCKPGTQRVEALCEALGRPQRSLRVLHVTGTNGKGSFCAIVDAMLTAAGYRVGRFSTPALCEMRETVTVNGESIPEAEFAALAQELLALSEKLPDPPTEFELLTALALKWFDKNNCDLVLLECGMGGLTDATNVIDSPVLSVITGVSVDHTSFLGTTVAEIARQKAGIIKEGRPVLWCGADPEAEAVIRAVATEKNAPLHTVPRERLTLRSWDLSGTVFDFNGREGLHLSLLGLYQADNAANALTAADLLRSMGWQIPEAALREGLKTVRWKGRFEVLSQSPLIIVDGGHNPEGIARAAESIEAYFCHQKVAIVTGIMADKDYRAVACRLAPLAEEVFCVTPHNPRALPSREYAAVFRALRVSAQACAGGANALRRAVKTGLPVVCLGSLYMYAELKDAVDRLRK